MTRIRFKGHGTAVSQPLDGAPLGTAETLRPAQAIVNELLRPSLRCLRTTPRARLRPGRRNGGRRMERRTFLLGLIGGLAAAAGLAATGATPAQALAVPAPAPNPDAPTEA